MIIEFDPAKDEANRSKHGISLARAADFVLARFLADDRRDYGEDRYIGWGHIDDVPYVMVYTPRGERTRVISLRRAHDKEMKRYVPST